MLHRTFWTERRFTGLTLLLGALLFLVGAFMPVTDSKGTTIYALPPREHLLVVFAHSMLWQWASILFISGTIVTILGLALLATQLRDAGDEVVLEVRDTGPGIPESELPRIFERFYRGTNVGEARASGSGLGLAIARSIVEMHRGSIEVASVVGKGTRFLVHLPRLVEVSPVPSPEPVRAARLPGLRRSRSPAREPAAEQSVGEP